MAKLDAVKRLLAQLQASRPAQATVAGFNRYIKAPVQWSGNKVRRSLDQVDDLAKGNRLVRGLRDGLLFTGPTRVAKHVLKQTARVHPGVAFGAGILGGAGAEFKHLDQDRRKARGGGTRGSGAPGGGAPSGGGGPAGGGGSSAGGSSSTLGLPRKHKPVRAPRNSGGAHQAAIADQQFAKTSAMKLPWRFARRRPATFKGHAAEAAKYIGDKAGGALVGSTTAFFWLPQLNKIKPKESSHGGKYDAVALSNPALQGMMRPEKRASGTARLCEKLAGEST